MSKHTPGPWFSQYDDNGYYEIGTEAPAASSLRIAFTYGEGETDEANAHLIAAAPDLINQLVIARDRVIDLIMQDDPQAYKEAKKALPAIEAAILKAKGE